MVVHLKGFQPNGDSNDVDIELESAGGLVIHANAHVIAHLKVNEVLVGLTPKSWNQIMHKVKGFNCDYNSLL